MNFQMSPGFERRNLEKERIISFSCGMAKIQRRYGLFDTLHPSFFWGAYFRLGEVRKSGVSCNKQLDLLRLKHEEVVLGCKEVILVPCFSRIRDSNRK